VTLRLLICFSLTFEYWRRKQPKLVVGGDNYSGSVVSKVKPRAQCGPRSQNQVSMNNGNCIVLENKEEAQQICPLNAGLSSTVMHFSGCLKDSVLYYKLRRFGWKTTDNKLSYFETTSSLASNMGSKTAMEEWWNSHGSENPLHPNTHSHVHL
jgi:hypothetical protein